VNVVLLSQKAYPIRWMVVGLVLMALFTIYPIFFTVWVSFTNYGEGHLITQEQAVEQILKEKYLPEAGKAYSWTASGLLRVNMPSGFRMPKGIGIPGATG
jgi:ABC-type sugar transport system permease subunit